MTTDRHGRIGAYHQMCYDAACVADSYAGEAIASRRQSLLATWDMQMRQCAHYAGRAFGFAFRAAELAYDLGQRHARTRLARVLRNQYEQTPATGAEFADEIESGRA